MASALGSSRQSVPACEGNQYDSSQNVASRNKSSPFPNKLMVGLKRTLQIPASLWISSGLQLESTPWACQKTDLSTGQLRLGPHFWLPHVSASACLAGLGFKGACVFYPCANESCKKPFPAFIVCKTPFHTNSALVTHSCKMKSEMYKACPVCFH